MEFKIPFNARAHAYTKEEEDSVLEAMRNANPLTQGKYLQEFEEKLRRYTGAHHAFGVCNATAALEMAAQLCCFRTEMRSLFLLIPILHPLTFC